MKATWEIIELGSGPLIYGKYFKHITRRLYFASGYMNSRLYRRLMDRELMFAQHDLDDLFEQIDEVIEKVFSKVDSKLNQYGTERVVGKTSEHDSP